MTGKEVLDFIKYDIGAGVNLYVHPSRKFKTTTLKLFLHRPLDENVTKAAILPNVLRRGCRRYVNMRKMVKFLEYLYGASLAVDVTKVGERHLSYFRLEIVNEKFLPKGSRIFGKALKFLRYLVLNPATQKGKFREDYLKQEKENLKNYIEGILNDRGNYAFERCLEEMCKTESFRLHPYGELGSLASIDVDGLTAFHREIVQSAPMDIFVYGDVQPGKVAKMVAREFYIKRKSTVIMPETQVNVHVNGEKEIIEKKDIEQGRLIIGARTYTTWADEDIFPLIFYSGVLGAFPHSKLFTNVREREGLAYSIHSSLEETKGLLFIVGGIDHSKYKKAVEVIKEQMADMMDGKISDEELDSTRRMLVDRFKGSEDSAGLKINSFVEMLINKKPIATGDIIARLESVGKKDVARVAEKIKIDTIYFLTKNGR